MSQFLGYGLLLVLVCLWVYHNWKGTDLYGKDEDFRYADPGRPRLVDRAPETQATESSPGYVGAVSRTCDPQASGYLGTNLRRIK